MVFTAKRNARGLKERRNKYRRRLRGFGIGFYFQRGCAYCGGPFRTQHAGRIYCLTEDGRAKCESVANNKARQDTGYFRSYRADARGKARKTVSSPTRR